MVIFFLLQLLLGDVILIKFFDFSFGLLLDQFDSICVIYGMDLFWWEQYVYVGFGFFVGDFGYFMQFGIFVLMMFVEVFFVMLLFVFFGLVVVLVLVVFIVGFFLFVLFVWLCDGFCQVFGFFVVVLVFWLGILFIQVFLFGFGWVLIVGVDFVSGFILFVLMFVVLILVLLVQVLVCVIDQVQVQLFVMVVWVKGVLLLWVFMCFVVCNVVVLILMIVGVLFGEFVGGVVVIEMVFGCIGIGCFIEQVVVNQDILVLQGVVLLLVFGFVVISFVVDFVILFIDFCQCIVVWVFIWCIFQEVIV